MRRQARQFRELLRLFFGRFVENDLICLDGDTRATLVNILAVLASPGILIPLLSIYRYGGMDRQPLYVKDWLSMADRGFFLALSMTVLGIVTVLEWDALFPDRRDYTVLRPFPIRLATLFAAKIAALAVFWAVFTLTINVFASVLLPSLIVGTGSLAALVWFIRCHVLVVVAGSAFVFLSIVALQGLLMNLLGPRWFRRASPYAQFVLIAALLAMFFASGGLRVDPLKPAAWHAVLPPAWFLGLYQDELGWGQPIFRQLASQAWLALAIAAGTAAAAFLLSYRRQVRTSLDVLEAEPGRPGRLALLLTGVLDRYVLRNPAERASFHFVRQTMLRSRRQKMLLAVYAGAGFALVFQGLAGAIAHGGGVGWQNRYGVLLPVPLVLAFFILFGMRYVFTIPAELKANWIFQVAGMSEARRYATGVRKAVVLTGIAPLLAILLPVYAALWGWWLACVHTLFGFVAAYLLADALLVGFEKLPFTCSYQPGKANMKVMWPVYVVVFVAYVGFFSMFEVVVLDSPLRLIWLFGFAAGVKACIGLYRRRVLVEHFHFLFEDQPEPEVLTLNLAGP